MSCFSCFTTKKTLQKEREVSQPAAPRVYNKEYETLELLGEGAFSKVKKAKKNETEEIYAVKIINKMNLSADDHKGLKQEIKILEEINHPNVIKLYDIFYEPKTIYLVTEIMAGGELFDRIVKKEYYTEMEAKEVCRIMFQTMDFCHKRKVAHRDLKPENLLLNSPDDDLDIKLADFGFAKKCSSNHSLLTQCGTPGYVAPEILNGVPYGTQADMWSLGVIIYILLAGYPPFNGATQKELFRLVKRGRYEFHEQYWGSISTEAKDLVKNLLIVDPRKRYTPAQALNCSWLNTQSKSRSLVIPDVQISLVQFRKFNAKRKIKQAVLTLVATKKMSHFVGMGNDKTFGFNQFKAQLPDCEPMSTRFVEAPDNDSE